MKELISFDQMLENIKARNEESRSTIEAAEKTVKIIDKIVLARESLGLSQRDLAKKCGMQQPALARIETGKVVPKLNTLIKIAETVGVNIEAFSSTEKQQMYYLISMGQAVVSSQLYNTQEVVYEN